MNDTRGIESYRHQAEWHHQTRGRNRERSDGFFSSEEGFFPQNNYRNQQQPGTQRRRAHSADSRPQYHSGTSSYREANGFSSSTFRGDSDRARAHSDIGVDGGVDSFRFSQLPRYDAVVHDDSILYSSGQRRQYKRNGSIIPEQKQSSTDFAVWENRSPTRSSAAPGRSSYNNPMSDHHYQQQRQSLYKQQEQQYYDFAKENLITFGDAPSASTGLSQEELLQRRRNEETREKRREKQKRNPIRNRIMNFPSSLLKSGNQQQNHFSQQNPLQNQTYQKMDTSLTLDGNIRGENIYDGDDNRPNPNGNNGRGKGIRESIVQRYMSKSKKSADSGARGSQPSLAIDDDSKKPGNSGSAPARWQQKDNFDRFMDNPNLSSGNAQQIKYYDPQISNTDHDYLLVQKDLGHSTHSAASPGRSRGNNTRPSYAEFTPRSDYTPRDLFYSKHPPYTKDTSPASVMDAFNGNSVRWNKNLTQQEVIITPQSTKLRPNSNDVQFKNSVGKPKSILRSRYSSSYSAKVQVEDRAPNAISDCPSDEFGERQPERTFQGKGTAYGFDGNSFNAAETAGSNPAFPMMGFVDEHGRDVSPIGRDRQGEKFPESYVQFIEAVAAVVIQTKVRQKLAKNKVQEMRKKLDRNRSMHGSYESKTQMTPMVRKSYALARKVRQGNEMKKSKGRQDVAYDFYALAAIQIQAAYRGWWVRDCLGVDNYCATLIQKIYRGYRCRSEFRSDLDRIVTVQSIYRRWVALDIAVTRIYCIVRIQAFMRGSLVRNRMNYESLYVYHEAATRIQTVWRSFWCEMTFLRAYEDILVVQSIVRRWIARRRFHSLKGKTPKFSQRFTMKTRQLKSRNGGMYSNPKPYMTKTLSTGSKPKISSSQPSVAKKVASPNSSNMDFRSKLKAHIAPTSGNKRFETMNKATSKPGSNLSRNSAPTYGNKRFETMNKANSKPGSNLSRNSAPTYGNKRFETMNKATSKPGSNVSRNDPPTNGNGRFETINKTSSKPGSNLSANTDDYFDNLRTQKADRTASTSRADIERRRKHKEQELKAQKEEEDRRRESQAAQLAELEFRRKRMAMKATERQKDNAIIEQKNKLKSNVASDKSHGHDGEEIRSNDNHTKDSKPKTETVAQHHFAKVKKSSNNSDQNNTHSSKEENFSFPKLRSIKVDLEKDKTEKSKIDQSSNSRTPAVASENQKSLVAKRHEWMTSNGNGSSTRNPSMSEAKSHGVSDKDTGKNKSEMKVGLEKEALESDVPQTGVVNTSGVKNDDEQYSHPYSRPAPVSPSSAPVSSSSAPVPSSSEGENQVVKRTNNSNSTYQKDMQSLRSDSEQRRIDAMHNIFEQAGLFSRIK